MKTAITKSHKDFVENLKSAGRSTSTILAYSKDLQQLTKHLFDKGVTAVEEITPDHLIDFIKELSDAGKLTQKSVSRKINSIKSFFNYLTTIEAVQTNPAQVLIHPKLEAKKPKILSTLEYMALREASRRDVKLYTMVEVLLQTGIRISELSGLELGHLDLAEQATLFIPKRESQKERVIPLNKRVREQIQQFVTERHVTEGFLFSTKSGNQILIRNIRATMERLFKRAGLKGVSVNDLRHTFTAYQLEKGVSLQTVSRVAGHKTLATTQKYLKYLKLEKPGSKEILEEL